MKRPLLILFFLALNIFCFSQELSKTDFLADLEYFKNTLPQKHTNLFAKINKTDFDKKVDEIALEADKLNYESFSAALFKLVVAIGDEHTRIEPSYTKILPIQFELFKEGLFVTGLDSANLNSLPAKLIAINGLPLAEITNRFKELIQRENQSYFEVYLMHFLNNPAFLKSLNIIESDSIAVYTISDKNGNEVKINLKSIPKTNKLNLHRADSYQKLLSYTNKANYWYTYHQEQKAIYFNYLTCREDDNKPFEAFNKDLFTAIEKYQPEKIILDLRFNSGGNSGILQPFIKKISQSYLNKKGKLFVLIGKKTFSSALMNAVDLKRNTAATFIGESTSGNINHYGEVRGFTLPKTKIVIGYSTKYWENWKGKIGPLKPDIKIDYSIKNFNLGLDDALIYVYGH